MLRFIVDVKERASYSTTSKGNQMKWVVYKDGVKYWLKADKYGYEGYAEYFASRVLRYFRGIRFVEYGVCVIEEDEIEYRGCYSKDMLGEGESLITFYDIFTGIEDDFSYLFGEGLLNKVVGTVYNRVGIDVLDYLQKVVKLDSLILNEDRHFSNLAVIQKDVGTFSECPIFDNGLSLLSSVNKYPFLNSIDRVGSKPFLSDFIRQIELLGGRPLEVDFRSLSRELKGLCLKGYENEYARCSYVLINRLKRLEGISWVRI